MENQEQRPRKGGIKLPDAKITMWCAAAVALLVVMICLALFVSGRDGVNYPVYMSEVLASNSRYPNGDGRCCDFIELYNSADYSVDLSGFQLGDMSGSGRYAFPSGTILEPGAYLTVYCDSTLKESGYAPFSISRAGGEVFYLIGTNGAIVDQVTTLPTNMDEAMIRLSDRSWGVSYNVTPGRVNDAVSVGVQDSYNSGISPVCISEFSAADNYYSTEYSVTCDWVELHNTGSAPADISGYILSDNVGNDKYYFPTGTVIPGDGYLLVCCSEGVEGQNIAPFSLSRLGGEFVVFKNPEGRVVELVETIAMDSGSQARNSEDAWESRQLPSPGFENTLKGHEAFLAKIGAEPGRIVISELMAASQYQLPDAFGDFSDWVELYNTGDETVHLDGWFLSDDESNLRKWQMPAQELKAGERLVVYLSGRDTVADGQLHTGFSLSAGGESLYLCSYLGVEVDSVTFGASEANTSFVFDGVSAAACTYPTPGYPNDDAGYEQFCASQMPQGSLAIWEVMTSNDWYLPQALGVCYDWVEIKNISWETVDLSQYSISDDPNTPAMFTLPKTTLTPGASVIVILSGDTSLSGRYAHAGFSLDAHEDQLLLFGPEGALTDWVFLRDLPLKHSYGRKDGTGGFFYMTPTPGYANGSGYRQISQAPTASMEPGVYIDSDCFTLSLEAEGPIYYTLDGSDPDSRSLLYREPIEISETTVVRAAAIENGKMVSDIYTSTFIIELDRSLPVASLVTDPDNLWGYNGIYKSTDTAYIKTLKKPANLSYTGEDGTFSLDCEISMHGATSLMFSEKKSFTVRFQDNYDGPLSYDVFEDGEVTHFSSLILRAARESGNVSTHIRDALMADKAAECSDVLICQKYKYVVLYLNGEYWGIYAFRELQSPEHYASYMNVPVDSVTRVVYPTDLGNTTLSKLWNFVGSNSLKDPDNYAYAKSVMDVNSLADWIIFEAYTGNFDIYENMRYFYSTADGLWRCALVDVDLGMFRRASFSEVGNSLKHGKLVRAFLQNDEFKDLIAKRLAELLAGPLSDESMTASIDAMADEIREEIPRETDRWSYTVRSWENLTGSLRSFCGSRQDDLIYDFCQYVGFSEEEKQTYFGDLLN